MPDHHGAGIIPALAVEVLTRSGRLRFRANGTSMLPVLRPGDELEFVATSGEFAIGDVVLWHRDDRLFVHRVVSRCGVFLQTQGDAVAVADEPTTLDSVLGRLEAYRRRGRRFPIRRQSLFEHCCGWCLRRSERAKRLFLQCHVLMHRVRGSLAFA
jgi:hypothetical protein